MGLPILFRASGPAPRTLTPSPVVVTLATPAPSVSRVYRPSPVVIRTLPEQYRDLVVADGAFSFWRLNESAGPSANDEVGANDATYYGAGWSYSRDAAIRSDATARSVKRTGGNTTYIGLPLAVQPAASQYSMEFWIRFHEGTADGSLAEANGMTGTIWKWEVIALAGLFGLRFTAGNNLGETKFIETGNAFVAGEWLHVVGIFNSVEVQLYINGIFGGFDSFLNPVASEGASGTEIPFGRDVIGSATFVGDLAELALYQDVQLTSDQIIAHYEAATLATPTIHLRPRPTAATVSLALPSPTVRVNQVVRPFPVELYVSDDPFGDGFEVTIRRTQRPASSAIALAAPAPTISASLTVPVDPVVVVIDGSASSVVRTVRPEPVALTLDTPAPAISAGGAAQTVSPEPVAVAFTIPAPTVTVASAVVYERRYALPKPARTLRPRTVTVRTTAEPPLLSARTELRVDPAVLRLAALRPRNVELDEDFPRRRAEDEWLLGLVDLANV